jgi:ergothioneine biosynthesis protein EgtB
MVTTELTGAERGTQTTDAGEIPPQEERYRAVRAATEALCRTLAVEDYVVQSMEDASPAKWHLAHVSWFFETFVLRGLPGYVSPNPEFVYLFNSYYNAVGPQFSRPQRGLLTRPTVEATYEYRHHVDQQMATLFDAGIDEALVPVIELGLHHEQQHQELLITDLKHLLSQNPLRPALRDEAAQPSGERASELGWARYEAGLYEVGLDEAGSAANGFVFDNEGPRHQVYLDAFELASRPATNADYLEFIDDGGYSRPELWLSDGWRAVSEGGWEAPLYWERADGDWRQFTLGGMRAIDGEAPVCHVSHYEADAYARWAASRWPGARLPLEAEWEVAAREAPITGNFVESGRLHPAAAAAGPAPQQLLGDVWEWTGSAYLPYPGYAAPPDAIGEYNGKFMSGQMVLRGGSCATPASHIRASYRNFFPAGARWQFSGIRLARLA